ncbi:hypothetical protein D3C71_1510890 [compost metagenome]
MNNSFHLTDNLHIFMSSLNGEDHFIGNDGMNIRKHIHSADGIHQFRIERTKLASKLRDQICGSEQGILAHRHRCGARVIRFTRHFYLITGHTNYTINQTNR